MNLNEMTMKQEQKKATALDMAKRIRTENYTKTNRWYFALIVPVLLVVGLVMDFQNVWLAVILFVMNAIFFLLRMETWKMANKSLEMALVPLGLIIMGIIIYYLVQHDRFSYWSTCWLIGAFFSPIVLMRALTIKQVNKIADDLLEKYKN